MAERFAPDAPCPCGAGRLDSCCGPIINGEREAATAAELMRSRYTANALGDAPYLLRTWHPHSRPGRLELDPATRWLGLKLRDTEGGQPGDAEGMVEFVARYKRGSRAHRLHERSRFSRVDGRWVYVDGKLLGRPG